MLRFRAFSMVYLFSKADISEALLNCVKLLRVQFAGDNVLHHFAVLAVNIPADVQSNINVVVPT